MADLKVGIDIDGILANFETGYAPILTKLSGVEFPETSAFWPNEWYWDRAALAKAGFSKEAARQIEKQAWDEIKASDTFWSDLGAHEGAVGFLIDISQLDIENLYFITHRVGSCAKEQTEDWLRDHGLSSNIYPTVLMTKEKGLACQILDIDYYIDDKDENCQDVRDRSPKTAGYQLRRPYNNPIMGVPILNHVREFYDILKGAANGVSERRSVSVS